MSHFAKCCIELNRARLGEAPKGPRLAALIHSSIKAAALSESPASASMLHASMLQYTSTYSIGRSIRR